MIIWFTFIYHIILNTSSDDSYCLMDNPIHFLYPKRLLQAPTIRNTVQSAIVKKHWQFTVYNNLVQSDLQMWIFILRYIMKFVVIFQIRYNTYGCKILRYHSSIILYIFYSSVIIYWNFLFIYLNQFGIRRI